jgi:DnaJ-domain-containing protein 1
MARPRFSFSEDYRRPQTQPRGCDEPGCSGIGEFRAPRSRDRLGRPEDYLWLCLDHVRAYNAAWNYYAGMSESEIEADLRKDTVWQRPTWPLGWRLASGLYRDPLHIFGHDESGHPGPGADRQQRKRKLTEEEKALAVFDLAIPFTLVELKKRYKALVKMHHPDANGGDKAAEERLKVITLAYAILKARFFVPNES